MKCQVCFRHCDLKEGGTGFCHARGNVGGNIVPLNYGLLTSIALDPIEKKPLVRFHPGSSVLSIGSFGCNLACPFCQNYEISTAYLQDGAAHFREPVPEGSEHSSKNSVGNAADPGGQSKILALHNASPEEVCQAAWEWTKKGNIGVAYTYNEALVGYEYVRDTARLVHQRGMKNVLVSNGCTELWVLEELLPYIDAMNIDLKSFREEVYRDFLQGDLPSVKAFIRRAAQACHVEITTLIVPGMNDTEKEIGDIADWIREVEKETGRDIPYHLSRYFPRYRMQDRPATPLDRVFHLAELAGERLRYVYTGNPMYQIAGRRHASPQPKGSDRKI